MTDDVSVIFGSQTGDLVSGVDQVKDKLSEVGDSAGGMSSAFEGLGEKIAAAFSIGAIVEFTKGALESANSLEIFSQRTGIAASTLSALNIPLLQNGSSVEEFSSAMRFMSRNIEQAAEGNQTLLKRFDELGVSVTALKSLAPEQQFDALALAMGKITDQSELAANMMGVFGRGAQGLIPVIKETGGNIKGMTDNIKAMGGALTDEQIAEVHRYDDAWVSMWEHFKIDAVEATLALRTFLAESMPGGGAGKAGTLGSWSNERPQTVDQATFLTNPAAGNNQDIENANKPATSSSEQTDNTDYYAQDLKNAQAFAELKLQQDKGNIQAQIADQQQWVDAMASAYGTDSAEYANALRKKVELQQEADKQAQAESDKYFKSLEQGMDTAVNGILQGSQTLKQGMGRLFDDLALKFIDDFVVKSVIEMAASYAKQLGLTTAFHHAMTAIGLESAATDAAAQYAVTAAANTATITADAALTFAGVMANLAPVMGPAAAGPAAAAEGLVLAQMPQASLDVGAWSLPNDMVAQLHAGEMVVPKTFAQGLQSNGGIGGGDQYTINISAIDTQSAQSFIQNNARSIVTALSQQARNGNPAMRMPSAA